MDDDRPLPFPSYGAGQCINCGFLGKRRIDLPVPQFLEATGKDRANGTLWKTSVDHDSMPWCFLRKGNLFTEVQDELYPQGRNTSPAPIAEFERVTSEAIGRSRDCPWFCTWQEGLTPKEHYEESQARLIEQRRKEWETQREAERRDWERQLEDERRIFETHLAERAEQAEQKRYNFGLLITAAAVIIAVGEVVAAVLGAGPGSILGKLLGLH